MEEQGVSRNRQIIITLSVLIVIAVIVAVAVMASGKDDINGETPNTTSQSTTSDVANEATETAPVSDAEYKDGTFSAEGGYNSPGGAETITIEMTLKDGLITATNAEPGATNTEAEQHQADFIDVYKQFVVGKNIDNLSLNRISGASLTTRGFNNALEQIKNQAAI